MWDDQAIFAMFGFDEDSNDYQYDEHTPYTRYVGMEVGHRYHVNKHLVIKSAYGYNWSDALHRLDFQLAYCL